MTTYIKETVANIEKLFGIELTDEQEEQLTYIIADAIQAGSFDGSIRQAGSFDSSIRDEADELVATILLKRNQL